MSTQPRTAFGSGRRCKLCDGSPCAKSNITQLVIHHCVAVRRATGMLKTWRRLLFLLWLSRLDLDLLQQLGVARQFRLTGRELAKAEHVRGDVRVHLAAELAGLAERHGGANSFEQVAHRQAIPVS